MRKWIKYSLSSILIIISIWLSIDNILDLKSSNPRIFDILLSSFYVLFSLIIISNLILKRDNKPFFAGILIPSIFIPIYFIGIFLSKYLPREGGLILLFIIPLVICVVISFILLIISLFIKNNIRSPSSTKNH